MGPWALPSTLGVAAICVTPLLFNITCMNKPVNKSTWDSFLKIIIIVAEEEKNACDKHSLHPQMILISNHKDSTSLGPMTAIPWRMRMYVFSPHPVGSAFITGREKCDYCWMEDINLSIEDRPFFKIWWKFSFGISVAMAQAVFFATLGNKLCKITKIFEELNPIKSWGSSANSKWSEKPFLGYLSGFEMAWLEPFQSHLNISGTASQIA